jgi:hypothetical protein
LLLIFSSTQMPLLSAVHPSDDRILIVSVDSPQADREYGLGEIVAVRVSIAAAHGSAITNATILGTTNWDMQFVHVPLLEVTRQNQSEVAVYAPDPNTQVPQGELAQDALISINNAGFLRLPANEGDWLLTLVIDPRSSYYLGYEARIQIHVRAPTPISLYLVAAGWVGVAVVGVFLLRRRKLRSKATAD